MDKNNLPKTIEEARMPLGVRLDLQSTVLVTETLKCGFDALHELINIAASWNKILRFEPDSSNTNQEKWIPTFAFSEENKRFLPNGAEILSSNNIAFSALLCFESKNIATKFGEQFIELWNDLLKYTSFKNVEIKGSPLYSILNYPEEWKS